MENIVFTLEFDDHFANSRANDYLEKGWTLLHVGSKSESDYNGNIAYNVVYVVGANQEQYEQYKEESKRPTKFDKFIKDHVKGDQ